MQDVCQAACGCSRICGLSVAECVVVGGIQGLRQGHRNAWCEAFFYAVMAWRVLPPTSAGMHGYERCGGSFVKGGGMLRSQCWWQHTGGKGV
jgi:hypothetical protein